MPIPHSLKLLLSALLLLVAMLIVPPVAGQDLPVQGHHGLGHDALHPWYQSLHDQEGRSCCSSVDCRPTQSREVDGRVEVIVDGQWTSVPREKILNRASPDLGSHVCSPLQPSVWPKGHIFCVVLGSGM